MRQLMFFIRKIEEGLDYIKNYDLDLYNSVLLKLQEIEKSETEDFIINLEKELEAIKKTNEVKHLLVQNGIQFAPVKQALFDCVSAKYNCCNLDKGNAFSQPLREYLSEYEELQEFNADLFSLIIEKIVVNRDSSINVELVNGQIINSNGEES